MKTILSFLILCAGCVLLVGCNESSTGSAPAGQAAIVGVVTNASTGDKVANADVVAGSVSTVTDTGGNYRLLVTVDSTTTVSVRFSRSDGKYRDTTVASVVLESGMQTRLDVRMTPTTLVGGSGSGVPHTIAFLGASPAEISVYGVGGTETSILKWEVRDSLGQAVTDPNGIQLTFTMVNGPGGGEYISPTSLRTSPNGAAYTSLNSGTRSGVVQVLAQVVGRTISSSPVRVVINGGFPVQDHFTVSAPYYNFPALDWVDRTLAVSVLVGDMYSNPVAKGTAVYFRTSAGVITPSVFTGSDGHGTVTLYSGNPYPYGSHAAALGDGYQYVVARTNGQSGIVTDSVLVLWSGSSMISNVNPTAILIDSAGSQQFTFTVSDRLGHPLAAGTSISVTADVPPPPDPNTQANQVLLSFGLDGAITLEDHILPGAGITNFSFTLSDGTTKVTQLTPVSVTISVSGPNGKTVATINGTVR